MIITLRSATTSDSRLLFDWRNDQSAYSNFFNPKPVAWEDHQSWLQKVLNQPNFFLYIVCDEVGNPIGQVRFDVDEAKEAEISVTIGKEFRGRGYGQISIKQASDFLLANHPEIKAISAQIKSENQASLKSFLSVGYREAKSSEGIIHLVFKK